MRFAALTTSYATRYAPAHVRGGHANALQIAARSTIGASDQTIIDHLTAAMTRAMAQDPRPQPARRNSFLPANLPQERWGLLMPAAVALALLLILAIVVVRMSG